MAEILESVSSLLVIYHDSLGESILVLDAYGTLQQANTYFDNRLRAEYWKRADNDDKKKAMVEATRMIDNLNFSGCKNDPDQFKEFPRNDFTIVPKQIEMACYEIALKLLEGYDPDMEIDTLASESQGYATVRSTYNRTFVLDHLRAGIPSAKAWQLLSPYLRDPQSFRISRA